MCLATPCAGTNNSNSVQQFRTIIEDRSWMQRNCSLDKTCISDLAFSLILEYVNIAYNYRASEMIFPLTFTCMLLDLKVSLQNLGWIKISVSFQCRYCKYPTKNKQ